MTEAAKQPGKKCPACEREYSEEDNYCGHDGSLLEPDGVLSAKHVSRSAGTPLTADDMNSESDSALQH